MFDIDNFHLSPFWDESTQVKLLLEPLTRHLGITYFDYTRFYHDNSSVAYFSDQDYVARFMRDDSYERPTFHLEPGQHIWQSYIPESLLNMADQGFGYYHGVTIFNKHEEYDELLNFSGPKNNHHLLSTYLNQQELLESFVSVFKENIEAHIVRHFANRIMLPTHYLYNTPRQALDDADIKIYYQDILATMKIGTKKKIAFVDGAATVLINREFECLRYIGLGYREEKIADLMKLSEADLGKIIAALFEKTNSNNRGELVEKIRSKQFYYIDKEGSRRLSTAESLSSSDQIKVSNQERHVSKFLVQGKTSKEIGRELGLSYRTVEHYVDNIKNKFGLKRKAELVRYLLKENIIT